MRTGMKLKTFDVLVIFTAYVFLIVGGSSLWFSYMSEIHEVEPISLISSVFVSGSSAAIFASAFYIRKLYRDMFASLNTEMQTAGSSRLATVIYFLTRPLFACLISIFSVILMYEFVLAVSLGHVGVNHDFLLFVTSSSALVAIVTGTAVTRIEQLARHGDSFLRPPL